MFKLKNIPMIDNDLLTNTLSQDPALNTKHVVEYYLTVDYISEENYLLEVRFEDNKIVYKAVLNFTNYEDVYFNLFALIRQRNQKNGTVAILYIPDNWSDEEYIEFFQTFNHNAGTDNHLNDIIDGITIAILDE
jgi:hypothetical protein